MKSRKLWLPALTMAGLALATAPRGEAHKIIRDGKVVPHWVRYAFEFQLCGVALGSRALDRDPQNKIDRYSLFFVHGNPTALVAPGVGTITQGQAPPGGGVPVLEQTPNAPWLQAVSIGIPAGHVMWLYRRDDFAMGYVVDPLGFVTAITVAGESCPIAGTQQLDPFHTVRLGDDFRKVLFRYGYPDIISLFGIVGDNSGDLAGGGGGGAGGGGGSGGGGGRGGGGASGVSLGPPQRFYARNHDVQTLAMELGSLTRLQTTSSARLGSKSTGKTIPPLPPATLELRTSGFLGGQGFSSGGAGGNSGGSGGPGAAGSGSAGGAGAGAGVAGGGGAGEGGAGGGGTGAFNNGASTTYQLDYRETYNVMFTIRNNRVVRIFIWGDPDYFTDRQRLQMRTMF